MNGASYETAPSFEERTGDGSARTPDHLLISFEPGFATPSLRAEMLSVDNWNGFLGGKPVATIALKLMGQPVALHIGQSAEDLRALSDACLRAIEDLGR